MPVKKVEKQVGPLQPGTSLWWYTSSLKYNYVLKNYKSWHLFIEKWVKKYK